MKSFTHTGWRQWPVFIFVFLFLGTLSAQTLARLDFEDFDGELTTSPALDALGISFGSPSFNIDPSQFNGALSPVNAVRNTEARSGNRLALNCTSGIDCEFPDGVVLMEFAQTASNISFYLRGFDDGTNFLIYVYDDNGEVELLSREPQTLNWQRVNVASARGIIIDTDIPPGGNGFRTYYLDDVDWTPGVAQQVFDCATADGYEERLATDAVFRRNEENLERFTADYLQNIANEDIYGFGSEVITIPVVVHVVYNGATQNISDAQINSQIDALNELFRATNAGANSVVAQFAPLVSDLRLQFALAQRDPNCEPTTGITRTATTVNGFTRTPGSSSPQARNPVKFNTSGGRNAWPSDEYLNIWVCSLSGSLLGYATFPSDLAARPAEDGVVMDHTAFGTVGTAASGDFDLGRVTAHEIGHWLNLRHIWGDDNNAADICSGSDFVDDTPDQGTSNSGCPTFPDVSCSNGPDGDMFMNHMDYTDDVCRTMFSLGQHVRAAATLFGVRATIIGSDGLYPPPAVLTPDLWSQDTYDDIGDEPNASTERMYHSADIWVRNTNDGFTNQEHQNPRYSSTNATNYVYVRVRNRGCGGSQSGNTLLYWAKAGSGLSWPSPWDGSVVSPALMGSPLGSQAVTVDGGEFEILEYEWTVPNPADYAAIPGDEAHFCLLARTETAGGMTFPETTNLYENVQNNNNIVWKNVSVASEDEDGGGFVTQVIVGNFSDREQMASLRFDLPAQEVRDLFDYGQVTVELGELYGRWEENGGIGEAVEPMGDNVVELLGPGASLDEIPLEPGEFFGVQVRFKPFNNPGINNVFKLNMTQFDLKDNLIIGGNQFRFKTLAPGVIRPGTGNEPDDLLPVFVDCPGEVPEDCTFPLVVRVDMANVVRPHHFLGNFTAVLSWDPTLMELVDSVEILSGYTGFTNIDRAAGRVIFNGARVEGREGSVPVLSGEFRAIGPVGTTITPGLEIRTLVSAATFFDLTDRARAFPCELEIVPSILLGDVNGDGLINSTDAALILAFSVGNPVPPIAQQRLEAGIGNVDGNNRTNARDALIILTYDVGLPVDIPLGTATICPDEPLGGRSGGRSGVNATVEVDPKAEEDGTLSLPLVVDMTGNQQRLGSYDLDLTWDRTRYRFSGFEGGTAPGFDQPTINDSEIADGHLRLAHAHPGGAAGEVHLGTLSLTRIDGREGVDTEPIRVIASGMATAGTLLPVTPYVRFAGQDVSPDTPLDDALSIFPNPFRGEVNIDLSLASDQEVSLGVYDLTGRLVTELYAGKPGIGTHRYQWNGGAATGKTPPNGVYLLRGRIGEQTLTKRLVLLR